MLKIMRLACVMLFFCVTAIAQAQDYPKVEFFNSYSHAFGGNGSAPGWLTSIAVNRNRYLGYTTEFSHHYKTTSLNTSPGELRDTTGFKVLLFGVQFYIKKQKPVSPFFRLMFGGSKEDVMTTRGGKTFFGPGPTLVLSAGGGLDVKLRGHLAFRAIQIDHLNPGTGDPKTVRLSTGLVIRF